MPAAPDAAPAARAARAKGGGVAVAWFTNAMLAVLVGVLVAGPGG
jgi:hypothetical protein